MAKFNLNNFSLISLNIFVLSLLTFCNLTATSTDELIPNSLQEGVACSFVDCGEGSCVNSNASLMGFDCVCKPGWKKIQIGNLPFSACLIPNCTINFNCSDVSTPPPPPPPLPTSLPPPSTCNEAWCGEGTCADNGTGHTCQCFPGSSNLLDNSSLPCLQQCSLGEDCKKLGPVLPPPLPSPPPTKPTTVGPTQVSNSSSKLGTLSILLVAAIIQTWF